MKILTSALFTLALGLSSFGCAAPAATTTDDSDLAAAASDASSRTIRASDEEAYALLASTWAVHSAASPDELMVRVYELGGGDPAYNGTSLKLAIDGGPGLNAIWDLGANIRAVESVSVAEEGKVLIRGSVDAYDGETGEFALVPYEATATYAMGEYGLEPTLKVSTAGETVEVDQDKDPASLFLIAVYGVSTLENETIHARLFEVGGGDPVMNGDNLMLTLMAYPDVQTYELGLDVATVESFGFGGDGGLRIKGTEDWMTAEGEFQQRPFSYAIAFSVGDDGPSSTIELDAR
jgi:hypothetical protein